MGVAVDVGDRDVRPAHQHPCRAQGLYALQEDALGRRIYHDAVLGVLTALREHRKRGHSPEADGHPGAVGGGGAIHDHNRPPIRTNQGVRREKATTKRHFALSARVFLDAERTKLAVVSKPCYQGKCSKTRGGRNPQQ